jgi:adenine-specific DNA-methyltransferase
MAKIEITKTELVWPGKYNEDGSLKEVPRVNLPFQVIETINESRASREAKKVGQQMSLFDFWDAKEGETFEEGWRNKLIWGDNLLVMGSLLEKFAGKIDLIYIDPPFFTGTHQAITVKIGDDFGFEKTPSMMEEVAYWNAWRDGVPSFCRWIYERLYFMKDLLSNNGMIFIRFDQYWSHYVKLIADDDFGKSNFQNEIVVKRIYKNVTGQGKVSIPLATDSLFLYFSSEHTRFNDTMVKRDSVREGYWRKIDDSSGVRHPPQRVIFGKTFYPPPGKHFKFSQKKIDDMISQGKIRLNPSTGRPEYWVEPSDQQPLNSNWTDISGYSFTTSYPTENSETLLDRVLEVGCKSGNLVVDFFCGSGTTCAVAEKLGRRWIGCDLSRWAIHVTRKRLLGIENCKPFEVLNLGKYERKYWMGVTFGGKKKDDQQMLIFQYIAFMLKLHSAEPLTGMQHIHGKKGSALVHIGAVDAPVTIDEVNACIEECLAVEQSELHVLGWEWEMGMTPFIVQEAKRRGVKVLLLNIPREVMEKQAVDKGDIHFFEVAHLEVDIKKLKDHKIKVSLSDFAFPYADMIPDDVREKIKKWSDYIDYWAIDWNFRNDTFMNGWMAYRTRKERKLTLSSDLHKYDGFGTYTIMVKVVDIFGNDTSQTFEVEVK